jgi:outer membrane protein assembly factor BamB/streptogramin lyase
MLRFRSIALLLLAGCAAPAPKPLMHSAVAAVSTPASGEETTPLQITDGAPVKVRSALATPVFAHALPAEISGAPVAAADGTAYYYANGSLQALDFRTAHIRWRRSVDAMPGAAGSTFTATSGGVVFQRREDGSLLSMDAQTGTTQFVLPHARAGGAIDGVLFVENYDDNAYFAIDAKSGKHLWKTYGGGGQVSGNPLMHDGVLLQPFMNDGAILEDSLYAFDPKTGHALWLSYANNSTPLGFRGRTAYIDSTWFPEQTDNYVPLTVEALDVRTGKKVDAFTYAPDPQQNAATYRNSMPIQAYVAGGYVYLRVNGTWYRYDADRYPSAAHPSRLPDLDVAAALADGSLLVTRAKNAYIATASPDAMTLHALNGPLRSSVVAEAAGTNYAVAGTLLYAFDARGPRAIGSVTCDTITAVVPWAGNVAVLCARRELRFADATPRVPRIAVELPKPLRTRLTLHAFDIPPASGFMKQWWVGPIVPGPSGGVVIALGRGAMNLASSIGFVSINGNVRTVQIGHDVFQSAPPTGPPRIGGPNWPPEPNAIAYDKHGNVWFNNVWEPAIYKLDASRTLTEQIVGDPSERKRGGVPVRLALGADGEAWFARSHPTKKIARADGSRTFAIPPQLGDALRLVPAEDGGIWFLSQTQLVRVSATGNFIATPLPQQLTDVRSYPIAVTAAAGDSIWIAAGSYVARMNEKGVQAHYSLPDATLYVNAMVTGCDGSLYVAEYAPEVLRLPPNGKSFERYTIPYRKLDGLARTPDCSIWFVEGGNMPAQHVGTLTLHGSAGSP